MGNVIGGTYDRGRGKASMVIASLAAALGYDCFNGGHIVDLKMRQQLLPETTIWMPNVSNTEDKIYPTKCKGEVLICSKALRSDRTLYDAVARIFEMRANAVIAISLSSPLFKFTLVDALGNIWCDTTDIVELALEIKRFVAWSKATVREGTCRIGDAPQLGLFGNTVSSLTIVNKRLAGNIQNQSGSRFFGNLSTRCMSLFPSARCSTSILVSKRNVNKDGITIEDFVEIWRDDKGYPGRLCYSGEHKPSVDAPIHERLYHNMPEINFMIHGHAYIKGVTTTDSYYACGDTREAKAVFDLIQKSYQKNTWHFAVNLKQHGFLLGSHSLWQMEMMVKNFTFQPKEIK